MWICKKMMREMNKLIFKKKKQCSRNNNHCSDTLGGNLYSGVRYESDSYLCRVPALGS